MFLFFRKHDDSQHGIVMVSNAQASWQTSKHSNRWDRWWTTWPRTHYLHHLQNRHHRPLLSDSRIVYLFLVQSMHLSFSMFQRFTGCPEKNPRFWITRICFCRARSSTWSRTRPRGSNNKPMPKSASRWCATCAGSSMMKVIWGAKSARRRWLKPT